jgi:hypothetical protein
MTRRASLGIAATALILVPVLVLGQAGQTGPGQTGTRTQTPPRDTQAPSRDTPAQQRETAPPATARIAGRVVAADNGRPVRRARVTLNAPELGGPRAVLTEDDGSFAFAELPAGRYTMNVSQQGFVTLAYGQRRPMQPGTPIQLAQGQALTGIDFRLPRGSVVSGRVYDQDGEPMVGVMVRVMRYQYAQGARQLMPGGAGQTDDRGQYRIWGLNPGEYYVTATAPPVNLPGQGGRGGPARAGLPPEALEMMAARGIPADVLDARIATLSGTIEAGRGAIAIASPDGNFTFNFEPGAEQQMYAPTYYPGVPSVDDAQAVIVGVSAEVLNIDFPILLVQASRVAGRVITPDGTAVTQGSVNLTREEQRGRGGPGMNYGGRIQRDGAFSINGVPPGRYLLSARSDSRGQGQGRGQNQGGQAQSAPAYFGSQPIMVTGGDTSDVMLPLTPGATISGVVRFESTRSAVAADPTQVRITPMPATPTGLGQVDNTRVERDGTFTVESVAPGPHYIQAQAPQGWILKSVLVGGRETVDRPLDVTGGERVTGVTVVFTDRVAEIGGSVTDSRGTPITEYTVLAFPVDETLWRPQSRHIRTARTDQNGGFQIRGLPGGDYYLALSDPTEQGEWFEPAFLERHRAAAKRLTVGDGAALTENFTITIR